MFIVANVWLSLQHPNDNVYRPDENEFQNVTQHISVSMKDQHRDYFQPESCIRQISTVPHNNASPTPQYLRGDSGMDPSMDPSSSRAHGTKQKYIDKDCFFFVHKVIPASFCLSTKYHTNNSVVFSLISLVYLQLISKTPVTKCVRTLVAETTF